jgi:hypothetical protein
VTLRIDTSRALAASEDRAALVRAVVAGQPEDELDWIEWKIAGDLAKGPTLGTIARHILGMANRMPERASLHACGWAYLIMGAEPGSTPGIARVDPANLGQGIQAWLGTDGPAWWPYYDEHDGVSVLVVAVAPPKPGQRAFTLRKDLTVTSPAGNSKGYPAGTIFIRHPGRTEIAGPGDIRALEDRYAAPALESARAAEMNAERSLAIQRQRQTAEDLERRRARLMEIADLVIAAQFQAEAVRGSRGNFRFPEQGKLQSVLAGMDYAQVQAEMPEVSALAGAGQGFETFAAAVAARKEIEAAMRKLTSQGQRDQEQLRADPDIEPDAEAGRS